MYSKRLSIDHPIERRFKIMKNACIQCSIKECKHHCGNENYCSLNQIKVGTHESHPTKIECTDCESFVFRA